MDEPGEDSTKSPCKHDDPSGETSKFSQSRTCIRVQSCINENLRTSLQTCDVRNNEEKLNGLLNLYKRAPVKRRQIEAIQYIFHQLSAQNRTGKSVGFLPFDDALGIYQDFMKNHSINREEFRDKILDPEIGLCVYIFQLNVNSKAHIVLKSENIDMEGFLIELQNQYIENTQKSVRCDLTHETMSKIIKSMDSEYDKMVLKAVLFALHKRRDVYKLGIKPENATHFLSKVLTIADETENALIAADDIFKLKTTERLNRVSEKLQHLQKTLHTKDILPEHGRLDILTEKDALLERKQNLEEVIHSLNESESTQKLNQTRKRIASTLIEENRVKRRRTGGGRKTMLDSDDETFIANAIETKSTAHGRRHDTVLYTHHRVKKRHFLSLANYHLRQRGKALIKSATTVLNRARPNNIRSVAAKAHVGKWLFCSKKPPKTEDEKNESVHHQRAHVKNAKVNMFSSSDKESRLHISMDDKAYIRPGTDVGFRDVKSGVIFDVSDAEKQKKLPQHDFSRPEIFQTPASFRIIRGEVKEIETKKYTVLHERDQSMVVIRPKFYIGSTGSVWASDLVRLRHDQPIIFEEASDCLWGNELRSLMASTHDVLFYYHDTTMERDVKCIQVNPDCVFQQYEKKRLSWLHCNVLRISEGWRCLKSPTAESNQAIGSVLLSALQSFSSTIEQLQKELGKCSGKQLWTKMEPLQEKVGRMLQQLAEYNPPAVCHDILLTTDAGPGVGVSNLEVKFREVELARLFRCHRINRIHRAPGDSGQNEAERTNAAIGDAVVDGSTLKWQYHKAFDGLSDAEISKLSIAEVKSLEAAALEKNAFRVALEIRNRIDGEPGPAGGYMKCYVTSSKEEQFFFNTEYLLQYSSTSSELKRSQIPGHAYFSKILQFSQNHVETGEMYHEFLTGRCLNTSDAYCEYCTALPGNHLGPVPRPMPDTQRLPSFHYLDPLDTPSENRIPDDFHPRVQLKKLYNEGQITPDDLESIRAFAAEYICEDGLVKAYLEHLQNLSVMKEKRKRERQKKSTEDDKKEFQYFDWEQMFHSNTLKKQRVAVLDKYLCYHNLPSDGPKATKLKRIVAHIAASLVPSDIPECVENVSSDEEEYEDNDDDDDVLAVIGHSEEEEEDELPFQTSRDEPLFQTSRYGRRTTTYLTRRAFDL